MRAKLACLAAAAIVFAPGAGAARAGDDVAASELAGFILAPTLDAARAGEQLQGAGNHRALRGRPRLPSLEASSPAYAAAVLRPSDAVVGAIFPTIAGAIADRASVLRSPRAPPQ